MWCSRTGPDPRGAAARSPIIGLLLALLLLPAAAAAEASPAPAGFRIVELSGYVVLDGPLQFGADVLLRILPGAEFRPTPARHDRDPPVLVVAGALHIAGLPGAPIRLQVPLVVRSPATAVIEHVAFDATEHRGCRLTLAAGEAHLRHVTIEGGEAGLCVEASPAGSGASTADPPPRSPAASAPPSPGEVVVEDLRVRGAVVGVHLAEGAPTVRIHNSIIAGNGVGLRVDGGRAAVLDHVTFADNRQWDVQAASTENVAWSGSQVEPSCVSIAGRAGRGCERGSFGLAPLLFILGLLILLSEAGRYALTRLAVWVGLYSRLEKAELPEHPARAKLLELVAQSPGIHLRALVVQVGGFGGTAYHLQRLEQARFVSSRRDGLYRRFYPQGHTASGRPSPTTRERVLAAITDKPGIHPLGVAELLGLSRQLAAYHVAQLAAAGLVLAEPQDRRLSLRVAVAADRGGTGSSASPPGPPPSCGFAPSTAPAEQAEAVKR